MMDKTQEVYNRIYKDSEDFVFGNPEKELKTNYVVSQ